MTDYLEIWDELKTWLEVGEFYITGLMRKDGCSSKYAIQKALVRNILRKMEELEKRLGEVEP